MKHEKIVLYNKMSTKTGTKMDGCELHRSNTKSMQLRSGLERTLVNSGWKKSAQVDIWSPINKTANRSVIHCCFKQVGGGFMQTETKT